jgi:RNA polymerase sigma-70 factor (ECF subfamily)
MDAANNELLDKAIGGDRQALSVLLESAGQRVRDALAGAIPRRLQSMLTLDDLMQQTYMDAFLAIKNFVPRGDGSLEGWLTTLARRNLLDAIRMLDAGKRGGDARRVGTMSRDDSCISLYEWLARTGSTPSRYATQAEAVVALERCIEQLPNIYRQVVCLYDLEGQAIQEVATVIGRSPGAVYMLRARAHERLRELLGSDA